MEKCLKNHKEIIYEYGLCPCCEYMFEIGELKSKIDDLELGIKDLTQILVEKEDKEE